MLPFVALLINSIICDALQLQAADNIEDTTSNEVTHSVELTIEYTNESTGKPQTTTLQVDLFGKKSPKTTDNFYQLCTRETTPNYKNNTFHRLVKDFVIQGGQLFNADGSEFKSIYGKTFEDEFNGNNKHQKGALSMANAGKDTNTSQFFIVTTNYDVSYLDDKHTVFGQVRADSMPVLDVLNSLARHSSSNFKNDIRIVDIKDITSENYVPKPIEIGVMVNEVYDSGDFDDSMIMDYDDVNFDSDLIDNKEFAEEKLHDYL